MRTATLGPLGEVSRLAMGGGGIGQIWGANTKEEALATLTAAIEGRLAQSRTLLDLVLDPADGAGVSWLHRNTEVMTKSMRGAFAPVNSLHDLLRSRSVS